MTRINQTLRLKELAEEDIYFAKRDRELIEALHRGHSAANGAARADETPAGGPKPGKAGQPGGPAETIPADDH